MSTHPILSRDMTKEHAGEVTRAYVAWRQGVLDEKGIHAILAEVIRAVDEYRREKQGISGTSPE